MRKPEPPIPFPSAAVAVAVAVAFAALLGPVRAVAAEGAAASASAASSAKAALTVTVTVPQSGRWPRTLPANGNIAAWQEAVIGAETQGLRLVQVAVNVGDVVRRGQVLALLQSDTVRAELAASRANLAEAEAALGEARANAERARQLQSGGAISEQQIQQYLTAEITAKARVASLKARVDADAVRLAQTRITAPDDGVISARSAAVGAMAQPGAELFRLIRRQRLEWRAEVPAPDLARLAPGQAVRVTPAGGEPVDGVVRTVAPSVDPTTRNGLVYVDLPKPGAARAGMFARGEFRLGESEGLTLPATAVVLRDGHSWVFRVGPDQRVEALKVQTGRRTGDRIEIAGGLAADARIVEQGGAFLVDGDRVRVVDAARPAAPAQEASR